MGTPDGNVTRGELLAAGHEASQRLGDLNAARLRYRRAQARLAGRRWQLGLLRCALWLRGLVVTYLGRWGGVIVLPIVASAVAVSLGAVLRATPGAIAMAAIASGVVTVIAALAVFGPQEQRLARRLCPECRRPRSLTAPEAAAIGRPDSANATVYEPKGCQRCNGRGYQGRIGLFELLPIDEDLARRIVAGANEADIARRARERKIPGLRDDAASKLLAGLTSFDEIIAVSAW